jgi:hypothetical protein
MAPREEPSASLRDGGPKSSPGLLKGAAPDKGTGQRTATACRAISNSSFVGMTSTATGEPSGEM